MMRIFKRAFNSVIFNLSIAVFFFVIAIVVYNNKIPILKKFQAIYQYEVFLAMSLICSFFLLNLLLILRNKYTYLNFFTFVNKWVIFFFVLVLFAIMLFYCFILKYKIPLRAYLYFVAISYTAWVWCVYLNCCIRVLISINIKCSVFVATAVKAILIAIVAWLALYKNSGTHENDIINFFASYISLCYPLLDMYKYVNSEINEFDKQKKIEIEKNKIEKKQFNDVEQFINNCTNSDDLDDLDDLEKNINKKRKKLEKGKFAGVKKIVKICEKKFVEICDKKYVKEFVEICNRRNAKINAKIYIKKFATLEDLDNLEKIIVKKRNELENNNDTEKDMD